MSRLRKALAHGNGADGVLHTRDRGYQFKLDPERLDAYRFERLIADGRAELTGGRADRAAELLERALALWRGPPLGDSRMSRSPRARQRGSASCASARSRS